MRIFMVKTVLSATFALLAGCVVNAPPVAEKTPDGLVRVQSKQVDTVYAARGVSLVLPWGTEAEYARSRRIAAALATMITRKTAANADARSQSDRAVALNIDLTPGTRDAGQPSA